MLRAFFFMGMFVSSRERAGETIQGRHSFRKVAAPLFAPARLSPAFSFPALEREREKGQELTQQHKKESKKLTVGAPDVALGDGRLPAHVLAARVDAVVGRDLLDALLDDCGAGG